MGTEIEIRVVEGHSANPARVGDLTEARVEKVVWTLNQLHRAEISLSPHSRNADKIQLVKREIQIWLNGALEFQGVPRTIRGNSSQVVVGMEDWREIFNYRHVLNESLEYQNLDPQQIAQNLINYGQSAVQGTNPGWGITVYPWGSSGVSLSRIYASDRKGAIIEALYDFPTLDDGFDWDVEWATRQIRFYPARKGSLRNDMAMEYGRAIVDYTYESSASKMATLVDATGGTSIEDPWRPYDRAKSRYVHEDVAASNEYGVHVAVLPSGAKSDTPWLQQRATQAVNVRKVPVQIPTAKVIPNKDQVRQETSSPLQVLGNLRVGDRHSLRVDDGLIQLSGVQRVQSMTYTGDDDMLELAYTSVIPA